MPAGDPRVKSEGYPGLTPMSGCAPDPGRVQMGPVVGGLPPSFRRLGALAAGLACILTAACDAAGPAIRPPEVEGFARSELIDVLAPDTVPAIRQPEFEAIEAAASWLTDDEPVIAVAIEGRARAYPLAILIRHEIVDDELAGRKIAVTYSPLSDTTAVLAREVGEMALTFVGSGKLYRSALVLLDRQTNSLWPQLLAAAVLGPLRATELAVVPSGVVSFRAFRAVYPTGMVLKRPAGGGYGDNPYPGYDRRARPFPEFFLRDPDDRLPAMERVLGVSSAEGARAYPYGALAAAGDPAVVHDRVGTQDLVVFWDGGQRSALDAATMSDGRRIGSAAVFEPVVDGRRARFLARDGRITDRGTGSTWSVLGVATAGPLAGRRLRPVAGQSGFWFAWASFEPGSGIWRAPS